MVCSSASGPKEVLRGGRADLGAERWRGNDSTEIFLTSHAETGRITLANISAEAHIKDLMLIFKSPLFFFFFLTWFDLT